MPNDLNEPNKFSSSAIELTRQWGWDNASNGVLKIAQETLDVNGKKVGEILVSKGVMSVERVAELLRTKPEDKYTLDYFGDKEGSRVTSIADRIRAMQDQIAYYADLTELAQSKRMSDSSVHERCEALDAALMSTGSKEILVFSRHDKLKAYKRENRVAKNVDPVWTEDLIYAVGSRQDIASILQGAKHGRANDNQAHGGALIVAGVEDSEEMREITRIFDQLLSLKGTDLSIKPHDNAGRYKVRIRRWGQLIHPYDKDKEHIWEPEIANKILQLLEVRSGANRNIEIMRLPGDGNLDYRSAEGSARFRLNFIPLNNRGDLKNLRSVAIRLFRQTENETVTFDELGVPEIVREHIRDVLRVNSGVIVVMGPVGHGKSSLCAAVHSEHFAMYGDSMERLSIEHPIERESEGITQFELPVTYTETEEEAWRKMLDSFKRHDLDYAFVGEMRNRYAAEFCVAVGAMGQMAVATHHAKDTIVGNHIVGQTIDKDMRFQYVESYALGIGVRLLNCLCKHCSIKNVPPTEEERHWFEFAKKNFGESHSLPELVHRANPDGCKYCDKGYGDYVQIFELLPYTREVKDIAMGLLGTTDMREHRRALHEARTLSLLGSAVELLNDKKIDVAALLKI